MSVRNAVALTFKSDTGATRRVAFGDADKEFALKTATTKGLLKWSDTIAIYAVPLRDRHEESLLVIEYRIHESTEAQLFDAGVVDAACLDVLRGRYGAFFKFESK